MQHNSNSFITKLRTQTKNEYCVQNYSYIIDSDLLNSDNCYEFTLLLDEMYLGYSLYHSHKVGHG